MVAPRPDALTEVPGRQPGRQAGLPDDRFSFQDGSKVASALATIGWRHWESGRRFAIRLPSRLGYR